MTSDPENGHPGFRRDLTDIAGTEIENALEETYSIFSNSIPSQNLGFVDNAANAIDVTIGSRDFYIKQSPSLLRSDAATGTTGAVLWKVTPKVAAWLTSKEGLLWNFGILAQDAKVVELGSGISGLIGLSIAHSVSAYLLTDQPYVLKFLRQNLAANTPFPSVDLQQKKRRSSEIARHSNLHAMALDWEHDLAINVQTILGGSNGVDLVIACDCIYNDFLIKPFVQMCHEICSLRCMRKRPTVLLIAQQLRSDEIFTEWLQETLQEFHIWRLPDKCLSEELREGSGYVLHVAIMRVSVEEPMDIT